MALFTGSYNTFRLHHNNLIRGKNTPQTVLPQSAYTTPSLPNIEGQESNQEEIIHETGKRPAPAAAGLAEREPITASTVKKGTAIKADATRAANMPKDQLY